jgi:hypothetical protein
MKRKGYANSTVEGTVRSLNAITRHVSLLNQSDVLDYLNRHECTNSRKERLVVYLARFYEYKQLPFTPPRYKRVEKLPFIPTEQEIDQLISGSKETCMLPSNPQRNGCKSERSMESPMG